MASEIEFFEEMEEEIHTNSPENATAANYSLGHDTAAILTPTEKIFIQRFCNAQCAIFISLFLVCIALIALLIRMWLLKSARSTTSIFLLNFHVYLLLIVLCSGGLYSVCSIYSVITAESNLPSFDGIRYGIHHVISFSLFGSALTSICSVADARMVLMNPFLNSRRAMARCLCCLILFLSVLGAASTSEVLHGLTGRAMADFFCYSVLFFLPWLLTIVFCGILIRDLQTPLDSSVGESELRGLLFVRSLSFSSVWSMLVGFALFVPFQGSVLWFTFTDRGIEELSGNYYYVYLWDHPVARFAFVFYPILTFVFYATLIPAFCSAICRRGMVIRAIPTRTDLRPGSSVASYKRKFLRSGASSHRALNESTSAVQVMNDSPYSASDAEPRPVLSPPEFHRVDDIGQPSIYTSSIRGSSTKVKTSGSASPRESLRRHHHRQHSKRLRGADAAADVTRGHITSSPRGAKESRGLFHARKKSSGPYEGTGEANLCHTAGSKQNKMGDVVKLFEVTPSPLPKATHVQDSMKHYRKRPTSPYKSQSNAAAVHATNTGKTQTPRKFCSTVANGKGTPTRGIARDTNSPGSILQLRKMNSHKSNTGSTSLSGLFPKRLDAKNVISAAEVVHHTDSRQSVSPSQNGRDSSLEANALPGRLLVTEEAKNIMLRCSGKTGATEPSTARAVTTRRPPIQRCVVQKAWNAVNNSARERSSADESRERTGLMTSPPGPSPTHRDKKNAVVPRNPDKNNMMRCSEDSSSSQEKTSVSSSSEGSPAEESVQVIKREGKRKTTKDVNEPVQKVISSPSKAEIGKALLTAQVKTTNLSSNPVSDNSLGFISGEKVSPASQSSVECCPRIVQVRYESLCSSNIRCVSSEKPASHMDKVEYWLRNLNRNLHVTSRRPSGGDTNASSPEKNASMLQSPTTRSPEKAFQVGEGYTSSADHLTSDRGHTMTLKFEVGGRPNAGVDSPRTSDSHMSPNKAKKQIIPGETNAEVSPEAHCNTAGPSPSSGMVWNPLLSFAVSEVCAAAVSPPSEKKVQQGLEKHPRKHSSRHQQQHLQQKQRVELQNLTQQKHRHHHQPRHERRQQQKQQQQQQQTQQQNLPTSERQPHRGRQRAQQGGPEKGRPKNGDEKAACVQEASKPEDNQRRKLRENAPESRPPSGLRREIDSSAPPRTHDIPQTQTSHAARRRLLEMLLQCAEVRKGCASSSKPIVAVADARKDSGRRGNNSRSAVVQRSRSTIATPCEQGNCDCSGVTTVWDSVERTAHAKPTGSDNCSQQSSEKQSPMKSLLSQNVYSDHPSVEGEKGCCGEREESPDSNSEEVNPLWTGQDLEDLETILNPYSPESAPRQTKKPLTHCKDGISEAIGNPIQPAKHVRDNRIMRPPRTVFVTNEVNVTSYVQAEDKNAAEKLGTADDKGTAQADADHVPTRRPATTQRPPR